MYDTIGRKKLFHAIVRYNQPKKTFSCDCTIQSTIGFTGCHSLRTAYCCDNDFSYAATEDLYRSLPDRTTEEEPGHIFILNEDALPPGRTGAGNEGIATQKHWEVLWCRGDW